MAAQEEKVEREGESGGESRDSFSYSPPPSRCRVSTEQGRRRFRTNFPRDAVMVLTSAVLLSHFGLLFAFSGQFKVRHQQQKMTRLTLRANSVRPAEINRISLSG